MLEVIENLIPFYVIRDTSSELSYAAKHLITLMTNKLMALCNTVLYKHVVKVSRPIIMLYFPCLTEGKSNKLINVKVKSTENSTG